MRSAAFLCRISICSKQQWLSWQWLVAVVIGESYLVDGNWQWPRFFRIETLSLALVSERYSSSFMSRIRLHLSLKIHRRIKYTKYALQIKFLLLPIGSKVFFFSSWLYTCAFVCVSQSVYLIPIVQYLSNKQFKLYRIISL